MWIVTLTYKNKKNQLNDICLCELSRSPTRILASNIIICERKFSKQKKKFRIQWAHRGNLLGLTDLWKKKKKKIQNTASSQRKRNLLGLTDLWEKEKKLPNRRHKPQKNPRNRERVWKLENFRKRQRHHRQHHCAVGDNGNPGRASGGVFPAEDGGHHALICHPLEEEGVGAQLRHEMRSAAHGSSSSSYSPKTSASTLHHHTCNSRGGHHQHVARRSATDGIGARWSGRGNPAPGAT